MRMLLRQDGIGWRAARSQRDAVRERTGGSTEKALRRAVLEYLRPDFHPNQSDGGAEDALALAHRRLREIGIEVAA